MPTQRKKRATNNRICKNKFELGRRTNTFGPMHPVLRAGYNDARSRFSEMSECLLTVMISPLLFAPNGRDVKPGTIDMNKPVKCVARHDFDPNDEPFDGVFSLAPTNDIRLYLTDRTHPKSGCTSHAGVTFEHMPTALTTHRVDFTRIFCDCFACAIVDPRKTVLEKEARIQDYYTNLISAVFSQSGVFTEGIHSWKYKEFKLPEFLLSNANGRAGTVFMHAISIDARGTLVVAYSRSTDDQVRITILDRRADEFVPVRVFDLDEHIRIVHWMRIDALGDLIVMGQTTEAGRINQYLRVFKTGEN